MAKNFLGVISVAPVVSFGKPLKVTAVDFRVSSGRSRALLAEWVAIVNARTRGCQRNRASFDKLPDDPDVLGTH